MNDLLEEKKFDEFAEQECVKFYAEKKGRSSLAPGIYFRLLLVGYFEGIDSERGIAWRAADSLGLRKFLGIGLDEQPPDHSTISRNTTANGCRDASQGVLLNFGSAERSRVGEGQDRGEGCHDAGG